MRKHDVDYLVDQGCASRLGQVGAHHHNVSLPLAVPKRLMDLTNNWTLAGTNIDAIVANNDEMAIGAAMALQQAGKAKGEIPVVGVDGLPDGLAAIKRGLLAASVFQNPHEQATSALQAALKMIKGQPVESDIWVPYQLITPGQVPQFEARFK